MINKAMLKCCCCGESLESSEHINAICLMKKAKWEFPTWSNIILRIGGFAQCFVCDNCLKEKKKPKLAVEWDKWGRNIKYHPVEDLEDIDPEIFSPLDELEPGRYGVAG